MVENAKSAIETETMSFAYGPKTVENARIVARDELARRRVDRAEHTG